MQTRLRASHQFPPRRSHRERPDPPLHSSRQWSQLFSRRKSSVQIRGYVKRLHGHFSSAIFGLTDSSDSASANFRRQLRTSRPVGFCPRVHARSAAVEVPQLTAGDAARASARGLELLATSSWFIFESGEQRLRARIDLPAHQHIGRGGAVRGYKAFAANRRRQRSGWHQILRDPQREERSQRQKEETEPLFLSRAEVQGLPLCAPGKH